jgi:hypothetical protein
MHLRYRQILQIGVLQSCIIATGYGLDKRGIWDRVPVGSKMSFLHVVRRVSGAHPPSYPMGKAAEAWSCPLTSNKCRGEENMDPYNHSPIHPHGVIIKHRGNFTVTSWDITPSNPLKVDQIFGEAYLLSLQGWRVRQERYQHASPPPHEVGWFQWHYMAIYPKKLTSSTFAVRASSTTSYIPRRFPVREPSFIKIQ